MWVGKEATEKAGGGPKGLQRPELHSDSPSPTEELVNSVEVDRIL